MAYCMKCGGTIYEEGVSFGDETSFCKCAERKR